MTEVSGSFVSRSFASLRMTEEAGKLGEEDSAGFGAVQNRHAGASLMQLSVLSPYAARIIPIEVAADASAASGQPSKEKNLLG